MRLVAVCGLLLAVACDGPAIELVIERSAGVAADATLQVSVYALSDAHSFDCDAIAYGDVRADVLQATQVLSAPLAGSEGRLADVARLGNRLIVVRGYDDQGREAVRGCTAVADVTRRQQVTVALAPTTALGASLAEQLHVDLETGPQADPPIEASLVDAASAPLAGTVRVRVYGPLAELVSSEEQTVEASGARDIRVSAETPGPFAVELRSKNAIAPQPAWLSGFVEPANSAIDLQRGPSSSQLHLFQPTATSVAFVSVDGSDLTFAFPDTALPPRLDYQTLTLSTLVHDFLGQIFVPGQDGGQVGVVLWKRRAEIGGFHFLVIATPDAEVAKVLFLPGDGLPYLATTAIPLGRCDQHVDASPMLVVVHRTLLTARWGFVVDVTNTGDDIRSAAEIADRPLYSRCVAGPVASGGSPAWRRLLVQSSTVDGINGLTLTDLGPGLAAGATWAEVTTRPRQFIADAEDLFALEQPAGEVAPIVLVNRGVDAALFRATLLPASDTAIVDVGDLLLALPQVPRALALGPAVTSGLDVVALLSADSTSGQSPIEEPSHEWLYVATGAGSSAPVVAGTMRLPECRWSLNCELRALDLDADGLQEIVVAPVWLPTGASVTDAPARILHLGHR